MYTAVGDLLGLNVYYRGEGNAEGAIETSAADSPVHAVIMGDGCISGSTWLCTKLLFV